ncbi:MAG: DUF2063 domain-containing protein [Gammaproteobacteria bacterium]|nr:DUF2063 domain-containing protein [Gammaproteobacteria bacterium]
MPRRPAAMPDSRPGFLELQYRFTANVRNPDGSPLPEGIEDRRMQVYRDLMFNNVSNFLGGSFPVLRKVLGEDAWRAIMRDYFATHRARTPLFPRMPREFLAYLETERAVDDDPGFMLELARYEWMESAAAIDSREIDMAGIDPGGDLLDGVAVVNPLTWPAAFRYAVHRIKPDSVPDQPLPQPVYLVVFRDRDDKVGFMELNPVTARLLELMLSADGRSVRELLYRIAREIEHPNPDAVIDGGRAILERFLERGVVLGVRAPGQAS